MKKIVTRKAENYSIILMWLNDVVQQIEKAASNQVEFSNHSFGNALDAAEARIKKSNLPNKKDLLDKIDEINSVMWYSPELNKLGEELGWLIGDIERGFEEKSIRRTTKASNPQATVQALNKITDHMVTTAQRGEELFSILKSFGNALEQLKSETEATMSEVELDEGADLLLKNVVPNLQNDIDRYWTWFKSVAENTRGVVSYYNASGGFDDYVISFGAAVEDYANMMGVENE